MTSTCLLVAVLLAQADAVFEARTTDGPPLVGTLVELDQQRIVLETDAGRRELESRVLLHLVAQPRSAERPEAEAWVTLIDGSLLAAESYIADGAVSRVMLLGGHKAELPTRNVANVRFQPLEGAMQEQWEQILASDSAGDLLVVAKRGSLDYLEGMIDDVNAQAVEFELEGEVLPVRRDRVTGLVYHQSKGAEPVDAPIHVSDSAGSRFAVTELVLKDKALHFTTAAGLALRRPLTLIESIDFSRGKVLYLSDLQWDAGRSDWIPFVTTRETPAVVKKFYGPRRDRGFNGRELVLGGRSYAKGLALHSRTFLAYDLPAGFRRFEATVGIDDANVDLGHVVLQIQGDTRQLFSADLRGGDPPLEVSLDIGGVRWFSILVDFGEDLGVGDTLNLCDARIVK